MRGGGEEGFERSSNRRSKIQVIERSSSVLGGFGGTGHDGFSYADRNNRV